MISLNLITDRTALDVSRWQVLKNIGYENMTEAEKAEWAACKGAYNYTDLNRVEAAVQAIAEKLQALRLDAEVVTKSNWRMEDLPTRKDMIRYLDNVVKLRNSSSGLHEAPQPPRSMAKLDYAGANAIEATLLYVNNWADRTKDSQKYAGEFYGGEW